MPSTTLSPAEKLQEFQRATRRALSAVESASARRATAVERRDAVLAVEAAKVAAAESDVDNAVAALAAVVGVDVAASLLGVTKADVRRTTSAA